MSFKFKSLLKITAVTVLSTLAVQTANAKEVFPMKTFKVETTDSKFALNTLTANFSVRCTYRSGLFWPEPKSCGSFTKVIPVSNEGLITTPMVETFSGIWNSQKIDNYEISLALYNGADFIFSLNSSGSEAIASLARLNQTISFIKIEGTELDVTVNGNPFFGSDLSKLDRANLMLVTYDAAPAHDNRLNAYMLVTLFDRGIINLENMLNNTYPKRDLLEAKSVKIKTMYYATEGSLEGKRIAINATYSQFINYQHMTQYQYKQSFELSSDALKNLRAIDLTNVK